VTRKHRVLIAGAVLLLSGGIAGGAYATHVRTTIYTVSDVAAGLSQNPNAWVGRTVLVWGQDIAFPWGCGYWSPAAPNSATPRGAGTTACSQGAIERLVPARPSALARAGNGPRPWIGAVYSAFRFQRGLVVVRRPGAHIPASNSPIGAMVQLARLPVLGQLIPAMLVERGAVYRVRLLDPTRCTSAPCPQGQLL
jgi:hypothetical protein